MSPLYEIFQTYEGKDEGLETILRRTRPEVIQSIKKKNFCDVLVVGGGIHGACVAHLAAFNGLKTILLEREDYASCTSSRSSKMAHGGLRYLELFDFAQVLEGIKAREDLFQTAKHIVKPHDFFIPIAKNQKFLKLKLALGLKVYDFFVKNKDRKHKWWALEEIEARPDLKYIKDISTLDLEGGFIYCDGIMDDAQLVMENIIAARQEGAECLNYAEVLSFNIKNSGGVMVGWLDKLTNTHHETFAGIVINCAGPWVASLGRLGESAINNKIANKISFSQGSHLLFNKPWQGPALFLPMPDKARYYFVWPHFAGTLVGTTERPITNPISDPLPTKDEIDEILARLKKDLPGSGLDPSSLHYCYAGIRTLPLRGKSADLARISRKHIWSYSSGVLSLLGGKFTTASWTAYEGLKKAFSLTDVRRKIVPLRGRNLPGTGLVEAAFKDFQQISNKNGILKESQEFALRRFGSRLRFLRKDDDYRVISGKLLQGELMLAFDIEQTEKLEDLMRRRLGLEYHADYGLDVLDEIIDYAKRARPNVDWDREKSLYKERIESIKKLITVN